MEDVREFDEDLEQVKGKGEELRDKVRAGVQRVQDELQRADQQIRSFVAERPLTAVAIALGAGFVIGKLISRSRAVIHG